jgi:acyl carrier protein
MYDSREQFRSALIEFIAGPLFLRHAKLTRGLPIDGATALFEDGIIDSLGIIDLLTFVEAAIGSPVPMRKVDMRYFGSVDRICQSFWTDDLGGCS